MAEFLYEGKKVYYEVHGESGNPLVILNGIMMSTASWKSFIPNFKKNNIVILVDFLDQGQSERMTESYNHEIQVNVLEALLDLLPYEKYTVMGKTDLSGTRIAASADKSGITYCMVG